VTALDEVPTERLRYGVVLNDLDVGDVDLPFDLGSGWCLDRATNEEIDEFRSELQRCAAATHLAVIPQERRITRHGESGIGYGPLDRGQWRYTVIKPQSSSVTGKMIAEALRIADAELWVELWSAKRPPNSEGPLVNLGGHLGRCLQFLGRQATASTRVPALPDLTAAAQIVRLRSAFDDSAYPEIVRCIELFREYDVVSDSSPIKILGYFAVLEGLLSHNPDPTDPADSITRQLKRNLVLLSHRALENHEFGLDGFFGQGSSVTPDQVIGHLYGYRSSLTHGNVGSELAKDLNWLYGRRPAGGEPIHAELWIENFVRHLVRRTLLAALREPQLVNDLKRQPGNK
jgi:hypothetical protein